VVAFAGYCHCESCRKCILGLGPPFFHGLGVPAAFCRNGQREKLISWQRDSVRSQPTLLRELRDEHRLLPCWIQHVLYLPWHFSKGLQRVPTPTLHAVYEDKLVSLKEGMPKFRHLPPMEPGDEPDMMEGWK
jgi:hypothetical protein